MSLDLDPDAGPAVVLRLPAVVRPLTGGEREFVCAAAVLGDLLSQLNGRHPELGAALLERGQLAPYVNLFLNGRAVTALDTPLAPGDELILITAIVGG